MGDPVFFLSIDRSTALSLRQFKHPLSFLRIVLLHGLFSSPGMLKYTLLPDPLFFKIYRY